MTSQPNTNSHYLQQAIDIAVQSVSVGGGPFGAVVVKDGQIIATGENRVTRDNEIGRAHV